MGKKLVIGLVQQDGVGWTTAAQEAEVLVTLTAKVAFISPEGAGELTGASRVITQAGTGRTGAVTASTHRKIPAGGSRA